MTMPASNDDLISAGLLSWAKDVRYVNELQSLLVNAGDALVSGRLRRSVLTKGSWYASFLLYLIFVLGPKGKSLGMAASGLEFTSSMAGNSKEIRRSILATLLTVVAGVGALDWWASSKDREVVSASDDLRGIDRRQRHQMLRQQMFERSSGSTMASSNESAAQVGSQDLAWYEKSTEYVQKSLRVSLPSRLCPVAWAPISFSFFSVSIEFISWSWHRNRSQWTTPYAVDRWK